MSLCSFGEKTLCTGCYRNGRIRGCESHRGGTAECLGDLGLVSCDLCKMEIITLIWFKEVPGDLLFPNCLEIYTGKVQYIVTWVRFLEISTGDTIDFTHLCKSVKYCYYFDLIDKERMGGLVDWSTFWLEAITLWDDLLFQVSLVYQKSYRQQQ